MGRSLATTGDHGPTAQGDCSALDSFHNSTGNFPDIFPIADAMYLPDGVSKTSPTATFPAVGSFIPQLDHLAHSQSPESNSVNSQDQNCMGGLAWSDKRLVEIQQNE